MRVLCLAVVAALLAPGAYAQNYSVDVESTLHGLDIKIEPISQAAMLVVNLTNNTPGKVRCKLRYDAAPQPLFRSTTYVEAGRTESSVFRAKRKWHRVAVEVECESVAD